MPRDFKLQERLAGFVAHVATPAEKVMITTGELVSPDDPAEVQRVLGELQKTLFSKIPKFMPPLARHVVIIIRNDLSAVAYVDECIARAKARTTRAVEAGEIAMASDIAAVEDVELVLADSTTLNVPDDVAVIVYTAIDWRRSIYYDFGPLTEKRTRIGPLSKILALQMSMLLGIEKTPLAQTRTHVDLMAEGYQALRKLLNDKCDNEAMYQELLAVHHWMLGVGVYSEARRHLKFDDKNIPDFIATRCADGADDIFELKQPFLTCFKEEGGFASAFNDAWNQVEGYLLFAQDNRDYLAREKDVRVSNPRAILLIGHEWPAESLKKVRAKETNAPRIKVITYDQLLNQAAEVLRLMRSASIPD